MKRIGASCLVLAACAVGAGSAAGAPATPPRAQLERAVCQTALDPVQRAISVLAVMRPLPGTRHMSLRFQLISGSGSSRPVSTVRGGDLGRWISPANATLGQLSGDVWKLDKQVIDLAAPDTYRFRVTFRWTGAGGRDLGELVRQSSSCYQPELRPDLFVQTILVRTISGDGTRDRYLAEIGNNGATAAGPFDVEFTDGGQVTFRTIQLLKPQQTRTLEFVGPACDPQSPPTVTVDPTHQVDDYNLANNSLSAVCPVGASTSARR